MTAATCHPDRPALAWGLCRACYDKERKAGTLPSRPKLGRGACERCRKVRKLYAKGRCKSCYNVRNARLRRGVVGAT